MTSHAEDKIDFLGQHSFPELHSGDWSFCDSDIRHQSKWGPQIKRGQELCHWKDTGDGGGLDYIVIGSTVTSQTCDLWRWLHGTRSLRQQSHELENLLLERESKLVALQLEDPAEGGVAAEEDGHLALPLLLDLREHLVPVWSACVRPRLESGHQVSLLLQDEGRIRSENYICTICGAL